MDLLSDYNYIYKTTIGAIGFKYDNYVLSELQILEKAKTRKNKTNNFIKDICKQIEYYLDGNLKEFQVDYIINGTNYQKKVLEAVSNSKYSETLTYSEVANKVKSHPRPVGNACRKNPLHLIIPCHRVIAINCAGGFAGSSFKENDFYIKKKNFLLGIERN